MTVNRKTRLFVVGILLALGLSMVLSIVPALADGGCYPGAGTPGYWKNHPEAWPVDEITIGGVTWSKGDAIAWMDSPVKKDKTITMFKALVAAKLNVAIGNPNCVLCVIDMADEWLAANPVGSGVRANSRAWQCGEWMYLLLDEYNNGEHCAPARD